MLSPVEDTVTKILFDFVATNCGVAKEEVSLESRLFHDFEMFGDDAVDFLASFSKRFGVDISQFPFKKFFPSEQFATGFDLICGLARMILGRAPKSRDQNTYRPLTVRHLREAIETRALLSGEQTEGKT